MPLQSVYDATADELIVEAVRRGVMSIADGRVFARSNGMGLRPSESTRWYRRVAVGSAELHGDPVKRLETASTSPAPGTLRTQLLQTRPASRHLALQMGDRRLEEPDQGLKALRTGIEPERLGDEE